MAWLCWQIAIAVVCVIVGAGVSQLWELTSVSTPANSPLVVDAIALNIGKAWVTDSLPWKFSILNVDDQPVIISRFETSCGCTSISPRGLTIPSGERREICAYIDLQRQFDVSRKFDGQPFLITVRPVIKGAGTDDLGSPWPLSGYVHNCIGISAKKIELGDLNGDVEQHKPDVLAIAPSEPAKELELTMDTSHCRPVPSKIDIAVDRRQSTNEISPIALVVSADVPIGRHDWQLRVCATHSDGSPCGTVIIPVTVNVLGDVNVDRAMVAFGTLDVGATATTTVSVFSRTGRNLVISDISSSSQSLVVNSSTSGARQTHLVQITLRSSLTPGQLSENVVITCQCDGQQVKPLFLPISANFVTLSER